MILRIERTRDQCWRAFQGLKLTAEFRRWTQRRTPIVLCWLVHGALRVYSSSFQFFREQQCSERTTLLEEELREVVALWLTDAQWISVVQYGIDSRHVWCVGPDNVKIQRLCFVRYQHQQTLRVGFAVPRMSTAHSMRVFGGLSGGTTSSTMSCERLSISCIRNFVISGGGGGGSANSGRQGRPQYVLRRPAVSKVEPSDTGLNSTIRHSVPPSGVSNQTFSTPASSDLSCTS